MTTTAKTQISEILLKGKDMTVATLRPGADPRRRDGGSRRYAGKRNRETAGVDIGHLPGQRHGALRSRSDRQRQSRRRDQEDGGSEAQHRT